MSTNTVNVVVIIIFYTLIVRIFSIHIHIIILCNFIKLLLILKEKVMIKVSKPEQSLTVNKFIKVNKQDYQNKSKKKIYIISCVLIISIISILFGIFLYYKKRNTTNYNILSPISSISSYIPSTPNSSYHPSTPV
jgi:hypothetical protein